MPDVKEMLQRIWHGRQQSRSSATRPAQSGPPQHKADGSPRRLGVEIEFSGLSLPRLCALLPKCVGGHAEVISDYEARIRETQWGTFVIELDFAFLKALGREQAGDEHPPRGGFETMSEQVLATVARQVVPFEVVTPPIPFADLQIVDQLCDALRKAGAKGTGHSPLYAFGVHLNIEMPDTEATTITRYIQAYALLFEWLRERCHPDLSRRLSPYIEPWPVSYARHVLQPDYMPQQQQLIDDYLAHNPTRNRALDMLPLLAHLDEARVRAVVDDDRIKTRPALHYRLPNCQIDEEDWHWRQLWDDWQQIESLAHDRERLTAMQAAFLEFHGSVVDRVIGSWAEEVRPWLEEPDENAANR